MKTKTLKLILVVVVLFQCALFALGIIQIQSESQFLVGIGVFNIMANTIFGAMNIKTLLT